MDSEYERRSQRETDPLYNNILVFRRILLHSGKTKPSLVPGRATQDFRHMGYDFERARNWIRTPRREKTHSYKLPDEYGRNQQLIYNIQPKTKH